jgi:hypothetical protein
VTYSQPQQQQAPYRPNRAALWVNDRKTAANQPDLKGNLEISWALLQELAAAFNAGQYQQDNGGQPCIKLDLALYAQQPGVSASGRARPALSGQLSTVTETQQSAAMRQQAAQQYQQQAPQGYAPQPQPQQPAPMPQAAPPQPQHYAPAPAAPAPMPQAAPQPAYQQPPMPQAPAPVAPPAPAQPMPGAIHGQPPAAPAPMPNLPPNF